MKYITIVLALVGVGLASGCSKIISGSSISHTGEVKGIPLRCRISGALGTGKLQRLRIGVSEGNMMNRLSLIGVTMVLILWAGTANADPITIYTDRASFLDATRQSISDTFSDYGAIIGHPVQLDNAAMNAVIGETRFEPLTFPELNLVTDFRGELGYCAGCNGNFKLYFDDTSLTIAGGVFGVAMDVLLHTSRRVSIGDDPPDNPTFPGEISVEFTNGETFSIVVPADVGYYTPETFFVGITDARRIYSLTVGTEPTAYRHLWTIDNLTIATQVAKPVPEPSTSVLMLAGLVAVAFAAKRRRVAGDQPTA